MLIPIKGHYSTYFGVQVELKRKDKGRPWADQNVSAAFGLKGSLGSGSEAEDLPIGPMVVPFWGSYVESYIR